MIYQCKENLQKNGVSITAVEKQAGLSNGAISKWNESSPTVEKLQAVAKTLECSVDDLLSVKEGE